MQGEDAGPAGRVAKMRHGNPWGLPESEAALMDAMCEHGRIQAAADAIGATLAAARARLRQARIRMAGHKPYARNIVAVQPVPTVIACLQWHKWRTAP